MIKSVKTQGYRSLYNFSLNLQPFTILIGKNDAGKSNVLRALELLLNDNATTKANKYDWSRVDPKTINARYPREINIDGVLDGSDSPMIRRRIKIWKEETSPVSELQLYDNGDWRSTTSEEIKLPILYYLHPRTGALQEALDPMKEHNIFSLIKDWVPASLSNEYDLDKLMRTYASTSDALTAYIDFFENEVYGPLNLAFPPDFPLIRFNIRFRGEDRNLLIVRELTHISQKEAYFRLPLSHHGSALISITAMVLSIAVLQEYHKQKFPGRSLIISIEEPEVHLHPGAQRIFLRYIKWASQTKQIIVTTHSPILVDRAEPNNVVILRRTTLREAKEAKAQGIDRKVGATVPLLCDYKTNWQGVIDTLGVKLSDALMVGEVNLLVEGPTEAILLPAMLKSLVDQQELNIDPDRIMIIHGEGGNLPNLANLLHQTGNPIVVMLDRDKEGLRMKQDLEKQESSVEAIFIPTIRNLPAPSNALPECEIEDLLDAEALLNALNEAYANIPGAIFVPLSFEDFKSEQMRLLGRKELFNWVATVNSLIAQKTISRDLGKRRSDGERFSKRILAETAAKYIADGRLPVPSYCKDILKKIEELLKISV